MVDDRSLLELCLGITGSFEGGVPSYSTLTGNFDGMGLSVGILQWNAGMGSLQYLLQRIGCKMGWTKAQTFFRSDIQHLSTLPPRDAIHFCLDHYIADGSTNVDPAAAMAWKNFLSQPEAVAAQVELASEGPLAHSKSLVASFTPNYIDNTRPYAFFFDLVTQSGGMRNKRGSIDPVVGVTEKDWQPALNMAQQKNTQCYNFWNSVIGSDPLAQLLMYYAYRRSLLSNPIYVWDALSRRGSIACRGGFVHQTVMSFPQLG